jgi:hypothetical protein
MDLGVDGAMRAVLRRFMGFDACFFLGFGCCFVVGSVHCLSCAWMFDGGFFVREKQTLFGVLNMYFDE